MKLPSAELWRGKQACWGGAEWMGRRRAGVFGLSRAGARLSVDTYTYCILYMNFFVTNFGYSAAEYP